MEQKKCEMTSVEGGLRFVGKFNEQNQTAQVTV